MARFSVKEGKKLLTESDADSIDIGTRSTCVVSIEDPIAAERHAEIRYDGESGRFAIEYLNSSTGTLRNGLPVLGPTELEEGDLLIVGRCRLSVAIQGGADGFELELTRKEKDFFHEKTDQDEWVRSEVKFGQFPPLRIGTWILILITAITLPLALFVSPVSEPLVDPGPLYHAHAALFEGDPSSFHGDRAEFAALARREGCGACHEAYGRTPMQKCAGCHADLMRDRHPFLAEPKPNADPAKVERGWQEEDCLLCHVDHRGSDPGEGVFKPTPLQMADKCAYCHGDREFDAAQLDFVAAAVPEMDVRVGYDGFPHDVHLNRENPIDCGRCHKPSEVDPEGEPPVISTREDLKGDRRNWREFQPVSYETCLECHAADSEGRSEELADWLPTDPEHRFQLEWHGTDKGEQKCLSCHAAVYAEKLNTVERGRVDRQKDWMGFTVQRRTHAAQFADHGGAGGDDCRTCHVGDKVKPQELRVEDRWFRHGDHLPALQPGAGALSAASLSEECAACHADQLVAEHLFAGGVYPGPPFEYEGTDGDRRGCYRCHRAEDGSGLLLERSIPEAELMTRADFPHGLHVSAEALRNPALRDGCYACHDFDASLDPYKTFPITHQGATNCLDCHEGHDNVAGSAGACNACHTQEDPAYWGPQRQELTRPWPELNAFDHWSPGHKTETEQDCFGCHDREGTRAAKRIVDVPIPRESDDSCLGCHVKDGQRFHWR